MAARLLGLAFEVSEVREAARLLGLDFEVLAEVGRVGVHTVGVMAHSSRTCGEVAGAASSKHFCEGFSASNSGWDGDETIPCRTSIAS